MLHYRRDGNPDQPTIVFLHGFLGSHADWQILVSELGDRFDCICIDLPGHGRSLHLPESVYTLPKTADLVVQVLQSLNCNSSHLYGYSMGGRLALYLALNFPQRWRSLYLESASPGLLKDADRRARQQRDWQLADALIQDFPAFLTAWYEQKLFDSLRSHPHFTLHLQRLAHNHPQELAQSLRWMGTGIQPSLWERLPELKLPCQLIVGEWDEKFIAINQRMACLSSKMMLQIVPQTGHNVHLEDPGAIYKLLRSID
jgi:2-succinyl-6-hydroxy-2,4-cyclohexadiene-1-carboxylate synthase